MIFRMKQSHDSIAEYQQHRRAAITVMEVKVHF